MFLFGLECDLRGDFISAQLAVVLEFAMERVFSVQSSNDPARHVYVGVVRSRPIAAGWFCDKGSNRGIPYWLSVGVTGFGGGYVHEVGLATELFYKS